VWRNGPVFKKKKKKTKAHRGEGGVVVRGGRGGSIGRGTFSRNVRDEYPVSKLPGNDVGRLEGIKLWRTRFKFVGAPARTPTRRSCVRSDIQKGAKEEVRCDQWGLLG